MHTVITIAHQTVDNSLYCDSSIGFDHPSIPLGAKTRDFKILTLYYLYTAFFSFNEGGKGESKEETGLTVLQFQEKDAMNQCFSG